MKTGANLKKRQGGAVAVMVGISIVLLVGFLALVMDLARVYLARTGLQNAADAAALSGAKQLNGTANGILVSGVLVGGICCGPDSSVAWAIRTGGGPDPDGKPNNLFFGSDLFQTQVNIGSAATSNRNIYFSVSPDGPWEDIPTAQASPGNKFFIKVDAGQITGGVAREAIAPLFAGIWNMFNMGAFGTAVAGPLVANIVPLGVCAIDVDVGTQPGTCSVPTVNSCNGASVKECGFLRGVAYNIPDLNPLSNGNPIWLNPVDAVGSGICSQSNGNTPILAPFLCTGKSAVITSLPGCVWVNTGAQAVMANPLNSRFGYYTGGQHCDDPATAPPDTNVQEYIMTVQDTAQLSISGVTVPATPNGDKCNPPSNCNLVAGKSPRDWMQPVVAPANDALNNIPTRQSIEMDPTTRKPFNYPSRLQPEVAADFARYGVLWSYSREVSDFSTNPFTNFTVSDWCKSGLANPLCLTGPGAEAGLYGGKADPAYPTANPAPYFDSAFSTLPTGQGASFATANRRVLNIAIIDCSALLNLAGQSCVQQLPVLAIGKFFMQRRADLPNRLYGEFAGLLPPSLLKKQYILYQ